MQDRTTDATQEGQDRIIDLPEDEPDLIARMIQFCYFDKYSLSLYTYLSDIPHARPIEVILRQSFIGPNSEFRLPNEPTCDALLHFKMFNIADKYEIPHLETYALNNVKKFFRSELGAMHTCISYLEEMSDMAIDKVEPLLVQFATGEDCVAKLSTVLWPASQEFATLEELRPKMAERISTIVQKRYPESCEAYRKAKQSGRGKQWLSNLQMVCEQVSNGFSAKP